MNRCWKQIRFQSDGFNSDIFLLTLNLLSLGQVLERIENFQPHFAHFLIGLTYRVYVRHFYVGLFCGRNHRASVTERLCKRCSTKIYRCRYVKFNWYKILQHDQWPWPHEWINSKFRSLFECWKQNFLFESCIHILSVQCENGWVQRAPCFNNYTVGVADVPHTECSNFNV